MLVRASQALLDAPKKKQVPVSCKRVFHDALLDCCSQFIAKSERAPPAPDLGPGGSQSHRLPCWGREAGTSAPLRGPATKRSKSPAPFVQQNACALREWMHVQDAMAPLLWAV